MPRREKTGGKLPFRYLYKGKPRGKYYITVAGEDVNLQTTDPDEARRRMARAKKGERDFRSDSGAAAAKSALEGLTGTGDATTPPVVEPPAPPAPSLPPPASPVPPAPLPSVQTSPAALPPVGASSAPPGPTPVTPDGYIPPPPGWADSVRAAAAEAGASSAPPAGEGNGLDGEPQFTPEMLDDMVNSAAEWIVHLQIGAQSWLAAHAKPVLGVNLETAPVPADAKGIRVGRHIWRRWLNGLAAKYMPKLEAPDWLLAPILVGSLTLPIQFGPDCKIKKTDDADKETATAPEAPPAAAT